MNEDLISKAAAGDVDAFEAIYREHAGFVYNVAFRILGHREDAQEIVQEVFLTVHDKLKDFRLESSFRTWVYRITANASLNWVKKMSKTKNKTSSLEDVVHEPATSPEVEIKIKNEYHEKLVARLLAELNGDQRACVVLREIESLSYEEIAQALNININTVRTRLKRAREKMVAITRQVDYAQL